MLLLGDCVEGLLVRDIVSSVEGEGDGDGNCTVDDGPGKRMRMLGGHV